VRLAFFGNGAMARVTQAHASAAGDEIGVVLTSADASSSALDMAGRLAGHDAAIDFSRADGVLAHVAACMRAGVPLVEGTTGWQPQEPEARRVVESAGGTMVYGANFSVGVNLFYRLVARAAELFEGLGAYGAFIEEAHHARKKDAPSGTALQLRRLLAERLGHDVPVASTRAGHIPGTHRVGFDSAADQVELIHTARSRDGFAAGALLAARWARTASRRGMVAFADVFDEIVSMERKTP
jgi:4-hydroxy-tetrahydrodipicolinate reductase